MYFGASHVSEHSFARLDKYNLNFGEVDCKVINDSSNYFVKYLGLVMDEDLNWTNHMQSLLFSTEIFRCKFIEIIVFLFSLF